MRTKVLLVCFAVSLMMVGQILGQSIRVTGRVIDQDDRSPLPGLNIVVKNTQRGTTTDTDGRYALENVSRRIPWYSPTSGI